MTNGLSNIQQQISTKGKNNNQVKVRPKSALAFSTSTVIIETFEILSQEDEIFTRINTVTIAC